MSISIGWKSMSFPTCRESEGERERANERKYIGFVEIFKSSSYKSLMHTVSSYFFSLISDCIVDVFSRRLPSLVLFISSINTQYIRLRRANVQYSLTSTSESNQERILLQLLVLLMFFHHFNSSTSSFISFSVVHPLDRKHKYLTNLRHMHRMYFCPFRPSHSNCFCTRSFPLIYFECLIIKQYSW